MTQKIKPVRIIDEETLKRGFQHRKNVDITIEQERAKMREFFKKESERADFIRKPE